jgi:hypothetical protein
MTTIPEEAFHEIRLELERQPLPINQYRTIAGEGRSQTFGVVSRRSLAPDYSRMNWLRPKLFHHLLEFGKQYVDVSWNAITLNENYKASPHYDRNNVGNSYLVAFGDFTGGKLKIHEGDLSGCHDINCKPIKADFSKILHSVEDFEGQRYSLVYYWFENSRSVDLPPCQVKKEHDKYYFYRGDEKITRKNGLPHPLRNRKKKEEKTGMTIQQGGVVTFH